MAKLSSAPRLVAVLGPTNTGKTHLAIDRMLGHRSGMIGFPLRLLARENYDRIVELRGSRSVALITGEEKILPPNPSYFVCTAESMPLDRQVDFLAVDEVQLCAFDVLAMDGDDLRNLPLSMRKANLARLLRGRPDGIFVSDFEQGD